MKAIKESERRNKLNILDRIKTAHKKMKADQPSELPYGAFGGWSKQLPEMDWDALPIFHGHEICGKINAVPIGWKHWRDWKRRLQYHNTWRRDWNIYCDLRGHEPAFNYPILGNPGRDIPLEFIRFEYSTDELLALKDNPTILEIGGGTGGQAESVLARGDAKYILVDLPEMLTVATYNLMSVFPHKKFLLYGERADDWDVLIQPNFMMPHLPGVDIVFNCCSFPEMDSETVNEYMKHIEVKCQYFMHINISNDVYWEDGRAYVGIKRGCRHNTPGQHIIPWGFKLIFNRPWPFATVPAHKLYGRESYREYLYEKSEARP